MKVQLSVNISGTRNGQEWPKFKAVVDLPKEEANSLIKAGNAVETDLDVTEPDFATEWRPLSKRRGNQRESASVEPPENAAPITTTDVPTK